MWIVTTISYGNRDEKSSLIYDHIKNYLVNPSSAGNIDFDQVGFVYYLLFSIGPHDECRIQNRKYYPSRPCDFTFRVMRGSFVSLCIF